MNTTNNPSFWLRDLLSNTLFQSVIGFLILMMVSVAAYYLLSKLRDSNSNNHHDSDWLEKNFEEMRSGGDINEAEFRNIKALLAGADSKSSRLESKPMSPLAEDASGKDAESGS